MEQWDAWVLTYILSPFDTSWIPENASYAENQMTTENALNHI